MMLLILEGLQELSIYLITCSNIIVVILLRFLQQIQLFLAAISLVSPILYFPSCLILDYPLNIKFTYVISSIFEPKSYKQASSIPHWQTTMTNEIQALEKNQTWDLVILPQNKTGIGCKWVYRVKFKADGSVERYKVRLVAKGYTQQKGLEFFDTYSLVAKMTTVRVLLTIAAVRQ
jgi:hypothetical protein